jgi:hypothetical protein
MDPITIPATDRSPFVHFDFENNDFILKGESYPEDITSFYGELIQKLEVHLRSLEGGALAFKFELIYFNSSTAKILMGLFEMLDECAKRGTEVTITWQFEEGDDNMEELGKEFAEDLTSAQFRFEPILIT